MEQTIPCRNPIPRSRKTQYLAGSFATPEIGLAGSSAASPASRGGSLQLADRLLQETLASSVTIL